MSDHWDRVAKQIEREYIANLWKCNKMTYRDYSTRGFILSNPGAYASWVEGRWDEPEDVIDSPGGLDWSHDYDIEIVKEFDKERGEA